MMISEAYQENVYIADFTNIAEKPGYDDLPSKGVYISTKDNGIIPSFIIHNENNCLLRVVNNERNKNIFTGDDGKPLTQCECIVYAERNDNKKGWLFFLELKYCEAKNRYHNMLDGIRQLITTYNYVMRERQEFNADHYNRIYLVISTPGVEPLDPFDAMYFNQDDILTIKEKTGGALLKSTNETSIKTPAVLNFDFFQ